jgi:hypothetical protein
MHSRTSLRFVIGKGQDLLVRRLWGWRWLSRRMEVSLIEKEMKLERFELELRGSGGTCRYQN